MGSGVTDRLCIARRYAVMDYAKEELMRGWLCEPRFFPPERSILQMTFDRWAVHRHIFLRAYRRNYEE